MTQELIEAGSNAGALAKPIDVVPAITQEWMGALQKRAEELPAVITTQAEADTYADVLNQATKGFNALNKRRLDFARSYDEERDRNVNNVAKPYLDQMEALKQKAKDALGKHAAKLREIERQRQAEANAEREKARQLALEAERRKEVAAKAVEGSKTEAQFEAAAEKFDKGVAVEMQANQMLMQAGTVPVPELKKPKGVKMKQKVAGLEVLDLAALPLTYHLPDLKKIERHILDGTLAEGTPGIRFQLIDDFSGSGR